MTRRQWQPVLHQSQQPFERPMRQIRGRAAAEEQRLDRLRRLQARELDLQRIQIGVDVFVLADGDGEIAIAAVMSAEGHMDICGTRPNPRGTPTGPWNG